MEKEKLRNEIALIDQEVIGLVSRRTSLAERIGRMKMSEGLPIKDPAVEAKVIARYRSYAEMEGLDPEDGERLAKLLIEIAIKKETQR
ncbi:MAG: chorismate mutase [Candidatus Methanomethylophilaceae archaeon]|jgi:chorismate mutase|nr:chorismate mutase [Candidatus Methanomethylophilaceae archaeon]MDI9378777.1 chorismate mutase [Candidatus Thermoplasmatota archaeon]MDD2778952.1 chorismate mutase [Candidatus Methanomethylophilaceae archaeon]MDD3128056.1 chorismate mutase [Candidatus Methanomethylophilaceae archaeon]MDD4118902.1 chorismate mutase [Candidatus Methanomethylophilaceae archaeon]